MTRAFVAVVPPESVLDAIERATRDVDLSGARRTTRAQWHLTLQFLGDVADLDAVGDALSGVRVAAAPVRLGGGGAFPRAQRATVLWLGVRDGERFLATVAREVGVRLTPLGYEPEAREFHPHLTLARAKTATDLRATVGRLDECDFGPAWTVRDVVLYESRLLRTGAEYVPRAVVRLPT